MDSMGIGTGSAAEAETVFRTLVDAMKAPRVLEMGTLRWSERSTHHKEWFPHASEYIMTDVAAGMDVDVVADAHTLSSQIDGLFDAVIAISVWEHLSRPWIAAAEIAKVLKPGGVVFICTHQSFPLHGYPNDYFRFSTEALSVIFNDAGLKTVSEGYQYPAQLIPPPEITIWNPGAPVFLNVAWAGQSSAASTAKRSR